MKKLILITLLTALPLLGAEYPFSIDGHTFNFYNGSPAEIVDQSGNGNDGTVLGATMTPKNGMVFDGVDDYIRAEQYNETQTTYSVTYWVNPEAVQKSYANIIDFRDDSDKNNCIVYFEQVAENNNLFGFMGGYTKTVQLTANEWQFIAVLYTTTPALKKQVLKNLIQFGTSQGGSGGELAGRTLIGTWSNGLTSRNFAGKIDNVRIDSVYLTQTQLTNLYNAGRTASKDVISTNGLIAFYDFQPPNGILSTTNSL